jgi:hypothetical protein
MGHGVRLGPIQSDDAVADEHGCITGWRSKHRATGSGYVVPSYHPAKGDGVRSGDRKPSCWAALMWAMRGKEKQRREGLGWLQAS